MLIFYQDIFLSFTLLMTSADKQKTKLVSREYTMWVVVYFSDLRFSLNAVLFTMLFYFVIKILNYYSAFSFF